MFIAWETFTPVPTGGRQVGTGGLHRVGVNEIAHTITIFHNEETAFRAGIQREPPDALL